MIDEMAAKVPDMQKAIFNFHDPPKDSTLDTCPMLDTSTDPPTMITSGGEPVMFGAGSKSVKAAIEKEIERKAKADGEQWAAWMRDAVYHAFQLRGEAGRCQVDHPRVGLAASWRGVPTTSGAGRMRSL